MSEKQKQIGLVWFGNDLRTHDHEALHTATRKHDYVLGLYCLNPADVKPDEHGFPRLGLHRLRFLLESLSELQQNLRAFEIPLLVFKGSITEAWSLLQSHYHIEGLYLQEEWTRDEVVQIETLRKLLPPETPINRFYQQFLIHPDDIPYREIEDLPEVFTKFRNQIEKKLMVRKPLGLPSTCKPLDTSALSLSIPSLTSLGIQENKVLSFSAFPWKGGESSGLQRLDYYLFQSENVSTYKKTRNESLGEDYSSKLSAWLANGSLSVRKVYSELKRFEREVVKNEDTYWLFFELLWRDFFKYISLKHGNKIFLPGGIQKKQWFKGKHRAAWEAWTLGNTKSSWVNAHMKELYLTGWMSNRGRQNVASYFAKTLKQDWRMGARWFESMLLDYDVHSNWGNWMYVSGVGNDPRDRIFNVDLQQKRYDPNLTYTHTWANQKF